MKTLIKNYITPQVDKSILQIVLNKKVKHENKLLLITYVLLSIIFLMFIKNLIILNIWYLDITINMFLNINMYLLIIINLIIWIINFVFKNILIIGLIYFICYLVTIFNSNTIIKD
jgi:hypothetical protein